MPPQNVLAQAIALAKKARPDLAPVETYGPVSRLWAPRGSQGYTSPAGTIYVDPDNPVNSTPEGLSDTHIHEQTHVDQMKRRGGGTLGQIWRMATDGDSLPYGQRPDELEAFQAESNYASPQGRATFKPSFTNPGGPDMLAADINLPVDPRQALIHQMRTK